LHGTDLNVIERPYDGCGKCLLGVRGLPRMKAATNSEGPEVSGQRSNRISVTRKREIRATEESVHA
jgi:hypothetical protein